MLNKFKSIFTPDSEEAVFPKSAVVLGVILIYLATIFLGGSGNMTSHEIVGFTIVMIIQLVIYLLSDKLFKNRYWLYFVIQGIITFDYAVIAPEGYKTIILSLVPLFVVQSMVVYSDAIKVIATACGFYGIFCGTILVLGGGKELLQSLPLLAIISIAMRAYSIIFFKQVKLRIQTQKVLQELALAYEKVEELTLVNERQRMARDLHDTLSQGLAGVIMQLEAVSANLNKDNIKRAQEIVQKSMEHARKTLADSRKVIDDLRLHAKEELDFESAVEKEINAFRNVSGTSITADIRVVSSIPFKISKHILYIVREALNNIAKHSEAENAVVVIVEAGNQISINIKDDGFGFDVKLLDRIFGHYGILGMTERVKGLNGKIKINSKRRKGTEISIIIPIAKGTGIENG